MIKCDNLVKIYKIGEIEVFALQGLDFSVQAGEMIGIVGASGSGKTTLLNVLGGLVRPSAGQVTVNGHNLLKLSDRELDHYRRTEVGFVWQQGARNLIPYLSALENVHFPMTLNRFMGKEARERARMLLDLVGLGDRMDHYLQALSGGEQQRVAIAVALANNPSILLGDEPTGELDSMTAQTIYDIFRKLNQELGMTTLIVSHDPDVARQVDRVVSIRDGQMASETVRVAKLAEGESDTAETDNEQFEELTVIDSAGRLQLPKAYLEALDIQERVHLELVGDQIVLRPAVREPIVATAAKIEADGPALTVPPKSRPWRFWRR